MLLLIALALHGGLGATGANVASAPQFKASLSSRVGRSLVKLETHLRSVVLAKWTGLIPPLWASWVGLWLT